ncbi:MAG: M48 family metallopeptidase [Betaproteobacteria bacterium]
MTDAEPPGCAGRYFDGRSARAARVNLTIRDGRLHVDGDALALDFAAGEVQWPERTRHGALILRLPQRRSVEVDDRVAYRALAATAGVRESWVVRVQQRWAWALAAFGGLLLAIAVLAFAGIPAAAGLLARHTPAAIERALAVGALELLDAKYLRPSQLPEARRREIEDSLRDTLARSGGMPEALRIEFRAGDIGPNALALPGAVVVLTDELVKLAPDFAALYGVFAHEVGHVRLRHGLRGLYESISLAVLAGALWGDYGSTLALAPAVLVTLAYSREREREADLEALRMLRAAGLPPASMARMFELLAAEHGARGPRELPLAFSSHPADAARIEMFRSAAP